MLTKRTSSWVEPKIIKRVKLKKNSKISSDWQIRGIHKLLNLLTFQKGMLIIIIRSFFL
jgi:hypothetical protein